MRIVLTGHTGLSKNRIVERIGNFAREFGTFQHFAAEGRLHLGPALPSSRDLMDAWWESFEKSVVIPWTQLKDKPKLSILSMHLSWQVQSHFFSPAISRHAARFTDFLTTEYRPDYVITLIDDIYRCQYKIRKTGYNFGLGELLRWRNVEVLLSDMLADSTVDNEGRAIDAKLFPYERSPVFAVNHPLSTFMRYFQQSEIPRIYLSYPITGPRKKLDAGDKNPMLEINHFRNYFSEKFTCFDPVTIDERPLAFLEQRYERNLAETASVQFTKAIEEQPPDRDARLHHLQNFFRQSRHDATVELTKSDRWPREGEHQHTLLGEEPQDIPNISLRQIVGVTTGIDRENSEIDRQIRMRDFRLIDQADCVVIYRPTYLKQEGWSGGTQAELIYAQTQAKKAVWVITDPSVDTSLNDGPFGQDLPPGNRIEVNGLSEKENRIKAFEQAASLIADNTREILKRKLR